MRRSATGFKDEPGTLPLGGSDPTERASGGRRPPRSDAVRLEGSPGAHLILDRYRMERRLGAGGFGVVWLAWDEKLEREVAVKVIPREHGAGERVEREARAAARLNRSEEHTSELQSQSNLVCRLLLEKKKQLIF